MTGVADGGRDEPRLSLPPELREELKEPFGPVTPDADGLLAEAGKPLVAVGDVVTYHLREAGRVPDVAVVDGYTEREVVDREIRAALEAMETETLEVPNPPATITGDLVRALGEAIERGEPTTVLVDGEEDLAALPAILLVPDGASVVYGQPGEGMVHVVVGPEIREEVRALVERFEGDREWLWALLEAE